MIWHVNALQSGVLTSRDDYVGRMTGPVISD